MDEKKYEKWVALLTTYCSCSEELTFSQKVFLTYPQIIVRSSKSSSSCMEIREPNEWLFSGCWPKRSIQNEQLVFVWSMWTWPKTWLKQEQTLPGFWSYKVYKSSLTNKLYTHCFQFVSVWYGVIEKFVDIYKEALLSTMLTLPCWFEVCCWKITSVPLSAVTDAAPLTSLTIFV